MSLPDASVGPSPARRCLALAEAGLVFLASNLFETLPRELGLRVDYEAIDGPLFLATRGITAALTVVFLLLLLRARGEGLGDLGLAPPRDPRTGERVGGLRLLRAVGLSTLLLLVVAFGTGAAARACGLSSETPQIFRVQSLTDLLAFQGVALLQGGFLEELLWRGWLLLRLEEALAHPRRPRQGLLLASGILAALFGLLHAYQGEAAAVSAAALALALTGLVVHWRRNLVVAMGAHALYDMVLFLLLFLGPEQGLETPP